jgi:hypothetical protein
MYRAGWSSVRERIIAAEVMKLEREEAALRGRDGRSHHEPDRSRYGSDRVPATLLEEALSFLWIPGPPTPAERPIPGSMDIAAEVLESRAPRRERARR